MVLRTLQEVADKIEDMLYEVELEDEDIHMAHGYLTRLLEGVRNGIDETDMD